MPGNPIVDISPMHQFCTPVIFVSKLQQSHRGVHLDKNAKNRTIQTKASTQPSSSMLPGKSICILFNKFQPLPKKKKNTTASVFSWLRAIIGLCHFHPDSHYSHWYQGISFNFQSLYSPLSRLSSRGQLLQGFMGKLVLPPLMPYSPGEGSVLWCF